jgi:hypothetical protein
MHDQAKRALQHRARNGALQERRQDEVRPEQFDGLAGDAFMDVELDRELVTIKLEFDVQPLRQAVERVHQQQDAHQPAARSVPRRYL